MRKVTPEEIPRRVAAALEGRASHAKDEDWGTVFWNAITQHGNLDAKHGAFIMAASAATYSRFRHMPRTPLVIVYEDGLVIAERYPLVLAPSCTGDK